MADFISFLKNAYKNKTFRSRSDFHIFSFLHTLNGKTKINWHMYTSSIPTKH